jgi:hypothetical protein
VGYSKCRVSARRGSWRLEEELMDGWIDGGSARNKEMNKRARALERQSWTGCGLCWRLQVTTKRLGQAWSNARRRRHGKEPSCTNGRQARRATSEVRKVNSPHFTLPYPMIYGEVTSIVGTSYYNRSSSESSSSILSCFESLSRRMAPTTTSTTPTPRAWLFW